MALCHAHAQVGAMLRGDERVLEAFESPFPLAEHGCLAVGRTAWPVELAGDAITGRFGVFLSWDLGCGGDEAPE